jgi:hypothetical protein
MWVGRHQLWVSVVAVVAVVGLAAGGAAAGDTVTRSTSTTLSYSGDSLAADWSGLPENAVDTVAVTVTVSGDFDAASETATVGVDTDGDGLADATRTVGDVAQCGGRETVTVRLPADAVADGSVSVDVDPSDAVDPECTTTLGGFLDEERTVSTGLSASLSYETNDPPVATAGAAPHTVAPGETVTFDADAVDPDGTVASYRWDLDGDGRVDARGPVVERTFDTAGDRTATLRVTDDDGATTTATATVTVNRPPDAAFTVDPAAPGPGTAVTVDADAVDPDGEVVRYDWDLDGDGAVERTGETVEWTFAGAGERTVRLRAVDDDGAADVATRTVDVNAPPSVSANATPSAVEPGDTVALTADATDPDGEVVRYAWDLDGDGTTEATGATVEHAYGTSGDRTVRVTVTDDDGATATATVPVVVNRPPRADLSHAPDRPATGQTVTLSAEGATDPDGEVVRYDWDLDGDGTYERTTTTPTVETTFESGGDHAVGVRVVDDDGATDTATATVPVWVRATVVVKPDDDGPAPVNPDSQGVTPVAVLADDGFDPAEVDVSTLRVGPPDAVDGGGAVPVHGGHLEDVDGDGRVDLVVHVPTPALDLDGDENRLELVAETGDDVRVAGGDAIRIVGDGGPADDREDGEGERDERDDHENDEREADGRDEREADGRDETDDEGGPPEDDPGDGNGDGPPDDGGPPEDERGNGGGEGNGHGDGNESGEGNGHGQGNDNGEGPPDGRGDG